MSYLDSKVFLLCFSVTDPTSLHNVSEKWLPEVRFHCPSAQYLLVATKVLDTPTNTPTDTLTNTPTHIQTLQRNGCLK